MRKLLPVLPVVAIALGFLSSCATTDVNDPAADGKEVAVDVAEEEEQEQEQVSAVYLPTLGM